MTSWFEKNRTLTLVIVNIASISVLVFIVELFLRSFNPAPIATFGLPSNRNGFLYGCGNEAIAEDLFKFLMTHYESVFRNYREAGAMPHPQN